MKPVLPSLREKKRYIGFEVVSDSMISSELVKKAVTEGIHNYIGDLGMAKAGMEIIEIKDNKGIMSAERKSTDMIKASLALITTIGEKKAIVKGVTVSGMLNKARKNTYGG